MYFEFLAQPRQGATWSPAVDVCERPDEIVIFVEMPGVQRSDVQLSWNQGVLIISGLKRPMVGEEGAANYASKGHMGTSTERSRSTSRSITNRQKPS